MLLRLRAANAVVRSAVQPVRSLGHYPRFQNMSSPMIQLAVNTKSAARQFNFDCNNLGKWGQNNETVYPPNKDPEAPQRPAEVYHGRVRSRISPKNMAHCCWFVQGMNVDDAIQRCRIHHRKTFLIMADILEEAKLKAADQRVEFPSNMHVATATCHQDSVEKHVKYNAMMHNDFRVRYTNVYRGAVCEAAGL